MVKEEGVEKRAKEKESEGGGGGGGARRELVKSRDFGGEHQKGAKRRGRWPSQHQRTALY